MRARWARGPLCAFFLGAAVLVVLWFIPGGLELTVRPVEGGEALLSVPLEPGERFTLYYIHSVDRAPIWEEHSVDRAGTIYVEEERFVMFGAGMGHWQGHGTLTTRGPWQVIEGIHAPVGNGPGGFILRVGSAGVRHALIWRGARVNLSQVAPHRAVIVAARPVNGLSYLWRRLVPLPSSPLLRPEHEIVATGREGQEP